MSSIFSEGPGPSQSSEAEMAALMKDSPELAADANGDPRGTMHDREDPRGAPGNAADPPAQAPETAATDAPAAESQQEPAAAEPAPAAPNPSAIARLSEENRHLKQEIAQFRSQMQAWLQQMQPQAQQPQPGPQQPEPPDPETDPIGALQYERQQRMQLQQAMRAQAVEKRVTDDYTADAHRFAGTTPDFQQARLHLISNRVAELRALGMTDQQIPTQIYQEEFGLAINALRAGKSPAENLYNIAKTRGYAPAAAKPAAPVAPDPALQEARAKAAVSLSEGGKPEKGGELSLDDIANLKGAAQESALKAWEKRNGGRSSIFRE
jgi:hypothetical protein